jgi:hypothetical protein
MKDEGEQPLPISFSYINNKHILYFHFPRKKSVVTLLSPSFFTSLQIGQVPKALQNFRAFKINLPGAGVESGGGGGGFWLRQAGSGALGAPQGTRDLSLAGRLPTGR